MLRFSLGEDRGTAQVDQFGDKEIGRRILDIELPGRRKRVGSQRSCLDVAMDAEGLCDKGRNPQQPKSIAVQQKQDQGHLIQSQ